MISRTSRLTSRARFAWVLWLVLIVPLAQFAANWHAQSHWDDERAAQLDGKHALGADPCELCLAACALSAGGAASAPLAVAHPPAVQDRPASCPEGAWPAPLALAYESRAPPSVLR